MLIILLVCALFRTLRGVPLASPSEPPDLFPALNFRDTPTRFGQRTVSDIVISCLATIFACTWSAVHPNIPAITDSAWTCFKRRVTITICALLAPELMTWWAMRQRLSADAIKNEYNKDINGLIPDPKRSGKGWYLGILDTVCGVFQDSPLPPPFKEGEGPQWTLAHGFFLQMGGFMLCESGGPIQTLIDGSREINKEEARLIWNIQQGVIDPPRITEEDIKDRSKGDAISKTFIILQTTWFILQCIARWSQRLPVTELEVITLGFAMLNGITYIAWWDKPQNVGRPVFLESKKPQGGSNNSSVESCNVNNSTSSPLLRQPEPGKESWVGRKLRQEMKEHAHSPSLLWRLPSRILHALGRRLWKLAGDRTVTKLRVGMFYTAWNGEKDTEYATAAIGALFGSVHLIPSWFLPFSSRQEMWLWRVSAVVVTAEPVLWGLCSYLNPRFLAVVLLPFASIGFFLYPISRIILLTLSLAALRSLPPGALQTIEWTTFIPHL